MQRFSYIVRDKDGKRTVGTEEAKEAEDLVAQLQAKGFLVLSVFPEEGSLKKSRKQFTHRRIRSSDLVFFSRQLAVMLAASVPLLRTLDTILKQVDSSSFYAILSAVRKNVEGGLSLKEALGKHPSVFNELWTGLIETGEASGNLPGVLERLANYLEKQAALRSKFISAIIYPAILVGVAIVAMCIFIFVVVPRFTEVFTGFGYNAKLPLLTRMVIGFSTAVGKNLIWIILGLAVFIFALKKYISTPNGKRAFDAFKLRLPLFGDFFRIMAVERFSLQMSILVESGVPIVYALEIVERAHLNTVLGDSLANVKEGVKQGKSLGKYLERELIFPALLVQMIMVGEESGELPSMLQKVAKFYGDYIDNFVARLSSAFEPAIIIFMGVVIGTIVIAMFLPIFNLANVAGGAH